MTGTKSDSCPAGVAWRQQTDNELLPCDHLILIHSVVLNTQDVIHTFSSLLSVCSVVAL